MKYVIYARKSTEEDDRQVLSIQAQLAELHSYSAKEKFGDVPVISVDGVSGVAARLSASLDIFLHSSRVWHHDARNLPAAALWCGASASGEDSVPIASAPGAFGAGSAARRSTGRIPSCRACSRTVARLRTRDDTSGSCRAAASAGVLSRNSGRSSVPDTSACRADRMRSSGMVCTSAGTVPPHVRTRVQAFVSDGFRGSQRLSEECGWLHQRCHFHLLASLVRGKSRRRYATRGNAARTRILGAVRVLLTKRTVREDRSARRALHAAVVDPTTPTYIRKHVLEFLERGDDFRAYLRHPKLDLPTTTNAVESTGRLVRKATRTARTPRSVQLRATAFLRLKRSVMCNGTRTQN